MNDRIKTWRSERVLGLCALVLLAVVCGGIGFWWIRSEHQKQIVTAIRGGTGGNIVQYAYNLSDELQWTGGLPSEPSWLLERLGIDHLETARGVTLHGASDAEMRLLPDLASLRVVDITTDQVTEGGLSVLEKPPALERLVLSGLTTSDDALAVLPKLPRLRILEIDHCNRITDAAIDHLCRIAGLEKLTLVANSATTNVGLAKLGQLTKLDQLEIEFGGDVTDAALEVLQTLPKLRRLRLMYEDDQPVTGLKFLGGLANLEELEISGPENLSDDELLQLPALPRLKKFSIDHCNRISTAGLKCIEKMSNLREVDIDFLPGLDDSAIAPVALVPHLEQVSLSDLPAVGDASLEAIGRRSRLRTLRLTGCERVTDAGLPHLAGLHDLTILWILVYDGKQLSPTAITALRKSLPRCEIHYGGLHNR